MQPNGFKYYFLSRLLIFGIVLFHGLINGQQKICIGKKTNYWVDEGLNILTNDNYSWYVNSENFKGSIKILNSIGNQIEIDWKDSKEGKYILEVSKSNSCGTIKTELEIYLEEKIAINIPTTYYICPDENNINIDAPLGYSSYKWFDENNQLIGNQSSININLQGKYKLIISDGTCIGFLNFEVLHYVFPNITIRNHNIHTIYLHLNQTVDQFNFQLLDQKNNIIRDWQNSPIFENIGKGSYLVKVKSLSSNCITNLNTEIMAIPNVITPNGDGFNDYWDLSSYQNIKEIHIFDRYGKKLVTLNSDFKWNGKINGSPLPSTTYWYQIILTNDQKIEGNLLIKN